MSPEERTLKLAAILAPIVEQIIAVAPQLVVVLGTARQNQTEKDKLN